MDFQKVLWQVMGNYRRDIFKVESKLQSLQIKIREDTLLRVDRKHRFLQTKEEILLLIFLHINNQMNLEIKHQFLPIIIIIFIQHLTLFSNNTRVKSI